MTRRDNEQVLLPQLLPFIYSYLPWRPCSPQSTHSCPSSRVFKAPCACPLVPSSSTGEQRTAEDLPDGLDFLDLNTIVPAPSCVLRGEYYIQLPQRTVQLLNGNNVAYNLTTFLGAANLLTLSPLEIQRDILDETHQDGPFDLLQPAFNLTSCQMDSSVVYRNLKTLVVKLASDTVHEQLFSVLVPEYSMEPQSVLEHIWQSYVDDSGVPILQSAQVYYTTFLNAMQPFYDLEEYPIDVAGVFMAHIEPTLMKMKSFRVHYPDFGQACERTAIIQRWILMDMLKALIRAEADVSNILEIVSADKREGDQFHVKPSTILAYPSVAEQTINLYTPGSGDALKSVEMEGKDLSCFGCGHPHLWSKKANGKWIVICPNKDQPGIRDRVKLAILQYQTRQRRKTRENRKCKNVRTLNLEDLPWFTQDQIFLQHRAKASGATTNATSQCELVNHWSNGLCQNRCQVWEHHTSPGHGHACFQLYNATYPHCYSYSHGSFDSSEGHFY
jgi:hypothetical protein